jgi:hypothetical protein
MTHRCLKGSEQRLKNLLYPELRPYGRIDRDRLLREASKTSHDLLEWAGILAALVLVGVLTGYSAVGFNLAQRFVATLMNFFVALLLLGGIAGPFLVRRTRRGLRSHLH